MSGKASASGRANRSRFVVEPLEGRCLLTVDFNSTFITVSDQAGSASIQLLNSADSPMGSPPAAQVFLSVGGGTAVPGVDYTPGTQTVNFAAGEGSTTVQIPVLPGSPSEGTRSVELTLFAAPGGPPIGEAYLLITHNADTAPPEVIASKVLTRGQNVAGFVLTFSKDMAPGPVQDVNNYAVANPHSMRVVKGAQWAAYSQTIPLKSATYDPATRSVTLTPLGKVRKAPEFTIMNREFFDELNQTTQIVAQYQSTNATPDPSQLQTKVSDITDTTGNPLGEQGSVVGSFYTVAGLGKAGKKLASELANVNGPPTT